MRPLKTFLLVCGVFLLAFSGSAATAGARELSAPAARPLANSYIVRHGDNLSSIAHHVYGNPGAWVCIWKANPWIDNPHHIQAGWAIYLPPNCAGHKGGYDDDGYSKGGYDDNGYSKGGYDDDGYAYYKGGYDDNGYSKDGHGGWDNGDYHIVRHGETLSGIACLHYKDCNYWRIYEANRHLIKYPGHIEVGWKLHIP
jgi:hypothetical protein